MINKQYLYSTIIIIIAICLFFCLSLFIGTINIPFEEICRILTGKDSQKASWHYIIIENRLPQALTAILAGSALSVSGLMLQTTFRNALAGPSVFGINSGAGLGVALVMLVFGGNISINNISFNGFVAVLLAAFIGALLVSLIVFTLSTIIRSNVMLLIIGIMIGYLSSSAIAILNFFATSEGVKSYLIWGLGSFGGVSLNKLPFFTIVIIIGLATSFIMIKPLNALLLGEYYAQNLGFNIRQIRHFLLIITGLLTAVVTTFCGPISFIGLAVPHIARLITSTNNHRALLPYTIALGSLIALICNFICNIMTDRGVLPLGAITPIIGAPVIIYVILRQRY